MFFKGRNFIFLSAIIVSGVLTACGSNQQSSASSAAAQTAPESTAVQSTQEITTAQSTQESTSSAVLEPESVTQTENITQQASSNAETSSSQMTEIGEERAKALALERAGVAEANATFIEVQLDRDDNRLEYDIEFHSNGMEYDVSVDAYTGEIREYSSEKAD